MHWHLLEGSSPFASSLHISSSKRESGESSPAWCLACSSATLFSGHRVQSVSELQFNYLTRVLFNHSWMEGGQRCVQYNGGGDRGRGWGRIGGVTRHIINTNPVQHGYRFKTFSCEISFGFTITGRMSGPDKANHCCKANAEGFSTSPPLLPPQSPEDLAVKENWESPGPKTDQAWSVPQSAPPSSSGSMIPLSQ